MSRANVPGTPALGRLLSESIDLLCAESGSPGGRVCIGRIKIVCCLNSPGNPYLRRNLDRGRTLGGTVRGFSLPGGCRPSVLI